MDVAETTGAGKSRTQVFVSYSTEPNGNSSFVRDLTGRLKLLGFHVWLDEEFIPATGGVESALRKAIRESEVGLFIVTREWLTRQWTKFEGELFGQQPDSRCVIVLRDGVTRDDLPPELRGPRPISWPAKDAEPNARFWEVYCGVANQAPGERRLWEERGAQLFVTGNLGASRPSIDATPSFVRRLDAGTRDNVAEQALRCAGRPVTAVVGRRWTFIVTDRDEWIGVGENDLHPGLTPLAGYADAIINAREELLIGMYEPMVVRLRGARWEYLPMEAPALCLASCSAGDVAGTAAGGVVRAASNSGRALLRVREPVVGLAPLGNGLVVLGSRGMLGRCSLIGDSDPELKWLDARELGRPIGLFTAAELDHVGVMSNDRLGILGTSSERVDIGAFRFEQGVRDVTFVGAGTHPYAVLTDAGELFMVSVNLSEARLVRFPEEVSIAGFCDSGGWGSVVAWTHAGQLYAVSASGRVQQIARDRVVLAYCSPGSARELSIVRWTADHGATVERVGMEARG